jgi:hypothetical protein
MARTKDLTKWVTHQCKLCKKSFTVRISKTKLYCSKKCSNNDPTTKQKIVQSQSNTYKEKYGCHPMQTEKTKVALKKTLLEKYGVEYYSQHTDHQNKVKTTLLKKYGVDNYNNLDKIQSTLLDRYGVKNAAHIPSCIDKRKETKLNNHYEFLLNFCKTVDLEPLFQQHEYKGYHFTNLYLFKCIKCSKQLETSVYNLNNLFCDYCHPEKITTVENQLYLFLQEILNKETIIKRNDRTVLVGKELDFYIPDKKYAFEIDGLYWHSETAGGINKNYHLNKTKSCMFHGIHLMHIFENEWIHKQDIVKSIIRTVLHCDMITKYHARKCVIKDVSEKEKNDFLNKNHLQGEDKSSVKIGLYHDGELVSLMTFRKTSRFDKTSEWELMRYCNKINSVINGAASKLFKYFLETYKPNNIVSYSDRRYFTGNLYLTLGFKFIGYTVPNYYYIINNYKDLRHRMSFQKHKLEKLLPIYDKQLTEWENMQNNKYDRIWDCGNTKWIYTKSNQ